MKYEPPSIDGFELLSVIGKGSFGKVLESGVSLD